MPVVDASVANGIPYVDAASEVGFVREVFERHAAARVPVIPGCGTRRGNARIGQTYIDPMLLLVRGDVSSLIHLAPLEGTNASAA